MMQNPFRVLSVLTLAAAAGAAPGPSMPAAEWNNRAAALIDQERSLEAEAMLRRAIRLIETEQGPRAAQLAEPLNNLGLVCRRLGRLTEAEQAYLRSLEIREAAHGENSRSASLARVNLARLYQQMGRGREAEALLAQAVAAAAHGGGDGVRAAALHNLAALLLSRGAHARALERSEQAIRWWRTAQSPADEAKALAMRAEILRRAGRCEQAAAAFRVAFPHARTHLGDDRPETARIQAAYARTLKKCGDKKRGKRLLAEAEALLADAPDRVAREHVVDASAWKR